MRRSHAISCVAIGTGASILTKEYLLGKFRTNGVNHDVFCLFNPSVLEQKRKHTQSTATYSYEQSQTLEARGLVSYQRVFLVSTLI